MPVLARRAAHQELSGRNAHHLRTVLAFLELAVGTILCERARPGDGRDDKNERQKKKSEEGAHVHRTRLERMPA